MDRKTITIFCKIVMALWLKEQDIFLKGERKNRKMASSFFVSWRIVGIRCEILHGQSFLYKLYMSDIHSFIVFLRETGEMTSIIAPALSNFIIKSNVGARNNSKSANSPLSSSNF